jgi:hypothetical protein
MDDLLLRLTVLGRVVVPLLLFMAWLYLLLHILFARFVRDPESPVLWFFAVVTGPLTRPVRMLLPPGTPEPRIRLVALAVYVALWLLARIALSSPGRSVPG